MKKKKKKSGKLIPKKYSKKKKAEESPDIIFDSNSGKTNALFVSKPENQ